MIELAFLWLVCGLIGAVLLSKANKAGVGCLIGIILGPLGLIITWMMRDDAIRKAEAEETQEEQQREGRTARTRHDAERECPYCAERILRKARVCKHCGRDVELGSSPAWHYILDGEEIGPVDEATLRDLFRTGELSPETRVKSSEMATYLRATEVTHISGDASQ